MLAIIKSTTKRGQNLIERANHFEGTTLADVYGKWSDAKDMAYKACRIMYDVENGYDFHIISFNTFGFSVAWKVADGIRIETPQNSYKVLIEEVLEDFEEDFTDYFEDMMPCDYSGFCGGITCKNFMNCKG